MRFVLSALFVVLCLISLLLGAMPLSWSELVNFSGDSWMILTVSRIPRLVTIVLTGIGLSICGVILQHIVRNKFVEPGTSGGLDAAKLGVMVSLTILPSVSVLGKALCAMLFCFITSLLYIVIIARVRFRNTVLIPVIGLMYGGVLSAIAEFYAYKNNLLQSVQGWLLGDFSKIIQGHYEMIYFIFPTIILTYIFAYRFTLLGMGEEVASSLGLSFKWMSVLGLILVSVTVSATVVTVGVIPFVGLVIPNLIAMKYGENLAKTLPSIALGGACLLLMCDILGRLIIYPFEVPIGLTAGLVGGVIFLILIFRGLR